MGMIRQGFTNSGRIQEFCKSMINAVHFHTQNSPSGTKLCLEY